MRAGSQFQSTHWVDQLGVFRHQNPFWNWRGSLVMSFQSCHATTHTGFRYDKTENDPCVFNTFDQYFSKIYRTRGLQWCMLYPLAVPLLGEWIPPPPYTVGSDVKLRQNRSVFIWCHTMPVGAAWPIWVEVSYTNVPEPSVPRPLKTRDSPPKDIFDTLPN